MARLKLLAKILRFRLGHATSNSEKAETRKDVEEELVREAIEVSRKRATQRLVFKDYRVVESYPLNPPWAYARILENVKTGEKLYYVDEVPLSEAEQKIYKNIMRILYWEIKPPPSNVDPQEYFVREAKRIVIEYRLKLGRTPGITWSKILYYVVRDVAGFGPIDPLMRDPHIEDISCNGLGRPIYVWHRRYEYIPTNIVFEDEEELDSLVVKLVHMAGKHISVAFPVVDAILPGGHRLAATYKKEVSTSGSTFTIRKFREDPITIVDMLRGGVIDPLVGAYLWLLVEHKMAGMIMGVTGAGKTSTLNALATLLRPNLKVVTIEDTPELRLPLKNWVQLVARPSYGIGAEKIGEITLFDLVKISLRYRPDIIIVGEVRGEEAYVLFQAMATGHGGMTTLHAEHIDAAVKRLTSPPMNIPPSYIPLMRFALLIRRVIMESEEGPRVVRRVTHVWEIVDYNNYRLIVEWDPRKDEHILKHSESSLLREIMESKGKDWDWVEEELGRRAVILQYMLAKGIRYYKDVAAIVYKYYSQPHSMYTEARNYLASRGMRPADTIV